MKSFDLNQFPSQIAHKEFTEAEGIQKIAEFISCNYAVFGLHLYDEDFRAEVIVRFLEKGTQVYQKYNPEIGDFFTYLYSYIMNIVCNIKKKDAKDKLKEAVTGIEIKSEVSETHYSLSKFEKEYKPVCENAVPYASSKLSADELKQGLFFLEDSKVEKTILTLALKSSFYLNDEMTAKIAKVIGVDFEYLSKLLEFYNKEMERKIEKRKKLESYRNKAYYCHKKYEKQIEILENEMDQESSTNQKYVYQAQIDKLKHNNKVQIHNWEKLNNKFQNGLVTVKPSNLSIANILGICERQVSYYIMCAKNGKTDLSDIYKRLEEMDKD